MYRQWQASAPQAPSEQRKRTQRKGTEPERNGEKNALHFWAESQRRWMLMSEWWGRRWWMGKEIQWMSAEEHTRKCVLRQQCLHSIDTKTESKQEKGTRKKKKKNSINFLLLLSSFTFYRPLSRFAHLFATRVHTEKYTFENANRRCCRCHTHTNDPKIFPVALNDVKFQSGRWGEGEACARMLNEYLHLMEK